MCGLIIQMQSQRYKCQCDATLMPTEGTLLLLGMVGEQKERRMDGWIDGWMNNKSKGAMREGKRL